MGKQRHRQEKRVDNKVLLSEDRRRQHVLQILRQVSLERRDNLGLRTRAQQLCTLYCHVSKKSSIISFNRPEGTIAVVLSSGAFVGYGKPGFMACLPWTESKYLVSMQDFVYESPNNEVWTKDNGKIHISLSILLKIVPEHEYVQQLVTNVNTINEIIDNNVTERVRALARSVETKHAYTLRGHHHAKGMLEQLNLSLSTKGILVKRVIITEV